MSWIRKTACHSEFRKHGTLVAFFYSTSGCVAGWGITNLTALLPPACLEKVDHDRVVDPEPSFHNYADPDPTFEYNSDSDLDPAAHQSYANLQHLLVYRTSIALYLSLRATIVSIHRPPWLHFEPLKLLYFDFNPDPSFHCNAGPDLTSQNNADPAPDPQPLVLGSNLSAVTKDCVTEQQQWE